MTAALAGFRAPTKFFAALAAADEHLVDVEQLRAELAQEAWKASFAPPIRAGAFCPCGARLEIRDSRIELTSDETTAAVQALTDGVPLDCAAEIIADVIDAINRVRADDDHQAMQDFQDAHTYCEDER